jgi:hypothetical protein
MRRREKKGRRRKRRKEKERGAYNELKTLEIPLKMRFSDL